MIIPKRPGSVAWGGWMSTFDWMTRLIENQLRNAASSLVAAPNDPDLQRTVDQLEKALSEHYVRADHFRTEGWVEPVENRTHEYHLCPYCKSTEDSPGGYVRVDVDVSSHWSGASIPCPYCNAANYVNCVDRHGEPPGMPTLEEMRPRIAEEVRRNAGY